MMEALGEWLKQIILVVLLATFIDLLLPNRTMQRYVRLVVSLFILMTILAPVLQLLGSNANLRMLAATVDGWSISGSQPDPAPGAGGAARARSMPALGEVLSAGEAMQRERDLQSLTLLSAKVESMVVEHLKTQHDVHKASVAAALALDADGYPMIESIRIRIGISAEAASTGIGNGGEDAGMRPIEPVTVDPVAMEPIRIGEEAAPEASSWQGGALPGEETKNIAASIAKAWGISASRVKVEYMK
jgi:stage III sporulation protein AF